MRERELARYIVESGTIKGLSRTVFGVVRGQSCTSLAGLVRVEEHKLDCQLLGMLWEVWAPRTEEGLRWLAICPGQAPISCLERHWPLRGSDNGS